MIQHRSSFLGPVAAAVFAAIVAAAAPVYAETELEACRRLAPQYDAETEVVLWDGTRCDLLSDTEAIEADWAAKWPDAIGQASWYSIVTGKRPAVLLLIRDAAAESRYIYRATAVCERLDMRLYLEVSPAAPVEGRAGD